MSFKVYYNLDRKERIFERIFDKYYESGYYGDIDKTLIKEDQKNWFNKFVTLIEKKMYNEIIIYMENRENKLTRETFDKIVGSKIKYRTYEEVIEEVKKYCEVVK